MENNTKKPRLTVRHLLENERFLLAISFVLALAVWIAISLNEAPEVERVVENVKVTIDDSVPSQLGYEVFGVDDIYVDITVKGKRYLVGDNVLTEDDFTVTAVTTHVDAPGNYSLQLKATAKDSDAEFTIVSKSMDNIEVYFDTPKTAEIPLETKLECLNNDLVYSDEYIAEDPILSLEKITVSGPATEIEKIKHAYATAETDGKLRKTETLQSDVLITDAYGAEIRYITVEEDTTDITVTIPVYKYVNLPVTVEFSNLPLYYIDNPPEVVCMPSSMRAAVDTNKLDSIDEISLGTVDFSTLKEGLNTLDMDTSDVTDAVLMNDDAKAFKVYITVEAALSEDK